MAAIFKIPQFSRQPQSEYRSINYSMRRKHDVLFMQLSQNLTEQRQCEFIIICSYIRNWCSMPTIWTVAYLQVAISRKRMS